MTGSRDQWVRVDLTRSSAGVFELFWNGVSQGTATDTTITEAQYFSLDFDAGDKLSLGDVQGNHALIKQLGVVTP